MITTVLGRHCDAVCQRLLSGLCLALLTGCGAQRPNCERYYFATKGGAQRGVPDQACLQRLKEADTTASDGGHQD